jgi:hypothetical protein
MACVHCARVGKFEHSVWSHDDQLCGSLIVLFMSPLDMVVTVSCALTRVLMIYLLYMCNSQVCIRQRVGADACCQVYLKYAVKY